MVIKYTVLVFGLRTLTFAVQTLSSVMHTFPSNVYGSTVMQVPYYTTHAQCMLHPHISREGASNDVKVLRTVENRVRVH